MTLIICYGTHQARRESNATSGSTPHLPPHQAARHRARREWKSRRHHQARWAADTNAQPPRTAPSAVPEERAAHGNAAGCATLMGDYMPRSRGERERGARPQDASPFVRCFMAMVARRRAKGRATMVAARNSNSGERHRRHRRTTMPPPPSTGGLCEKQWR